MLSPIAEVNADRLSELSFPPRLGEHNATIYGEVLGYSDEKLSELRSRQVI
ncbi:MAG TPA: hypothetical protein VFF70_05315 [Anaerolineae bacterium]|nr:hypothetical protein [Anaerolineae bacterium]